MCTEHQIVFTVGAVWQSHHTHLESAEDSRANAANNDDEDVQLKHQIKVFLEDSDAVRLNIGTITSANYQVRHISVYHISV